MATSAERQAAYRQRAKVESNQRRLSVWVSAETAIALQRLARRANVTQTAMLERLVADADAAVLSGLDLDSPAWNEYFHVTR